MRSRQPDIVLVQFKCEDQPSIFRSLIRNFRQHLVQRRHAWLFREDIGRLQRTSSHLLDDIGLTPEIIATQCNARNRNSSPDHRFQDLDRKGFPDGVGYREQPSLFDRPQAL